MPQFARLIGGAGTGKTRELLEIMAKNISIGYSPEEIGFCSFTRAARAEAAQRAAKQFGSSQEHLQNDCWFRTMHSVAYRQLNAKDALLSNDKPSQQWIENAIQRPIHGMNSELESSRYTDPGFSDERDHPTKVLAFWNAARCALVPLEKTWAQACQVDPMNTPPLPECRHLVIQYETAKYAEGRMDFTDLLANFAGWKFGVDGHERRLPRGDVPALPIWILDEAQDTSAVAADVFMRLVNTPQCKYVYIGLDPFQSVYSWSGASAKHAMSWPVDKERIMPQSYRCPKEILALGEYVLKGCSDYFDRKIAPAPHAGKRVNIWSLEGLMPMVRPDESWMLLARTNHMARQLCRRLDDLGVPWIPTRERMGGQNAPVRTKTFLALHALQNNEPIDGNDWWHIVDRFAKIDRNATKPIRLIELGTKTRFKNREEQENYPWITLGELEEVGATQHMVDKLIKGEWYAYMPGGFHFKRIVDKYGADAIGNTQIRVGTIHSTKGQEADNVALLTTISSPVHKATETQEGSDEEHRVVYVAVTRAKRQLVLLGERGRRTRRMRRIYDAKAEG